MLISREYNSENYRCYIVIVATVIAIAAIMHCQIKKKKKKIVVIKITNKSNNILVFFYT